MPGNYFGNILEKRMIVNKHAWGKVEKMSNFANFEDWRENEPWSDDGDDYDDDDVGYEEDDAGNVVRVGQERKNKQTSDDHSRVDLMAKYRCVLLWAMDREVWFEGCVYFAGIG